MWAEQSRRQGRGAEEEEEEEERSPASRSPVPDQTTHNSEDTGSPPGDGKRSGLWSHNQPIQRHNVHFGDSEQAGHPGEMSPAATDRVFPIRSVVSMDPTPTPSTTRSERGGDSYFSTPARRQSTRGGSETPGNEKSRQGSADTTNTEKTSGTQQSDASQRRSFESAQDEVQAQRNASAHRHAAAFYNELASSKNASTASGGGGSTPGSEAAPSVGGRSGRSGRTGSVRSTKSSVDETGTGLVTARFKHIVTEGGHAIITGRGGDTLQRCEDEPIHIPGAVQSFGLLMALEEESEGKLVVRVVSENSKQLIGYTPKQLFALESFTDILSEEQTDNLLDHVDFIRDEDADVATNGPEVFTMSIRSPQRKQQKLWCAMHINEANNNLIICEFELEDDPVNPLIPPNEGTPELPEDTLNSDPTPQEYADSTQNISRPLRVLRSARKRKGEAAAMEVFNIMSQVQEQLAAAPNLEKFLKVLIGVVKELTGFHRVMIYQFDQAWNGRVVTELVDPRATKDLYKGLNFPASDIPKQARELYKVNKVRMLYDRDQETARLVCRTVEDLENPLDLTYSYLRAMSPIHLKYLSNMAVRSSMSISINAFEELWGLIACHSYGGKGMRVSFPIRKMCRLVGETASRNIERLSYASRLQARKLINTVPTQANPSGYIIASSEDLLKLFDADFGLLSIRDETKILGHIEQSQEALAMLEYLRMRQISSVMTSMDIHEDFPDLRYQPGFQVIAGLLLVPLSAGGHDFIVFFRKGQLKEVKWAGNPYEKFIKQGTEGYLEPRKSFRTWSETVIGKCREWTEEEIETAAVLCLVYGKFIEVWRQKEAALQNSQLTRLLLANSAHEVRTPLNAIINYLEIALEGSLDQETRDNLSKSHSASKSLIYVINDLLDLTKTEEGGELVKDEVFQLGPTLTEATDLFNGDARRKNITYNVIERPGLPKHVIGDQRRIRQAITNVTANAIQNTNEGSVTVEMSLVSSEDRHAEVEIVVTDTGVGMSGKQLDALFRELEQVQSEGDNLFEDTPVEEAKQIESAPQKDGDKRTLGLGLAVVARVVRNMNGQLRLKSEQGKGSRFVIVFPFDIPEDAEPPKVLEPPASEGSLTPLPSDLPQTPPRPGELTLIDRGSGSGRRSSGDNSLAMSRKNSNESVASRRSLRSTKSGKSLNSMSSQRSEAERLIDAINEPHMVGGAHERPTSRGARPPLEQRRSTATAVTASTSTLPSDSPTPKRAKSIEVAPVPPHLREEHLSKPGEAAVADQRTPVKPLRMPEEEGMMSPTAPSGPETASHVLGNVQDEPKGKDRSEEPPTADNLRVLVAEDDPVNSRIIQKRLDKAGHNTYLTVNGEECSSAYGEKSGYFDVVLMDMQVSNNLPTSHLRPSLTRRADAHCGRPHLRQNDPIVRKIAPDAHPLDARLPQRPHPHHRRLRLPSRERTPDVRRRRLRRLDPQTHLFPAPDRDPDRHRRQGRPTGEPVSAGPVGAWRLVHGGAAGCVGCGYEAGRRENAYDGAE